MTLQETKKGLEPIKGLVFTATRINKREDTDGFNEAIHWQVTLERNGYKCELQYSEGIGHFINTYHYLHNKLIMEESVKRFMEGKPIKHFAVTGGVSDKEWRSFWKERVDIKTGEATPPRLDDVLYSLTSNADAINYSFEEWCSNYGYDSDSRRALKLWHACTDSYRKLKALGLNFEELQNRYQDY